MILPNEDEQPLLIEQRLTKGRYPDILPNLFRSLVVRFALYPKKTNEILVSIYLHFALQLMVLFAIVTFAYEIS